MNPAGLEELAILLDKQLVWQKKLLALEQSKTKVLVQGDIAKLDELLIQAQAVLLGSAGLENQRRLLQYKMGFAHYSIKQIAAEYDAQGRYMLKEKSQHLADILRQLQQTNNKNKKILQSRLSVLGQCLSLVGLRENACTYNAEGHF